MKKIESVNNQYVKDLFKLHEKKYREQVKQFLIEGFHLVAEAVKYNRLVTVLICNEKDQINGVENILVTRAIIEKLSFTKNPQNIIGVCSFLCDYELKGKKFLLIDNIQDPGNLGTLVRSSLGFDIDLVVLNTESIDIYNDKFIRATQGAMFKVKVIKIDLKEAINFIKSNDIIIIGTSLNNGVPLKKFNPTDRYALILGNEGNGVSDDILKLTDINVYIETNNDLESLNVAVAGSIIMFYLNN